MSVFEKDFLERIKSSKASGVSRQDLKCTSKTVSPQQMARLDAAIKQQRIEREKGGWRGAAKWLEENFPQDFGEAKAAPRAEASRETRSSGDCEAPLEPQPLADPPESPQSASAALPAPSPIPLASAFWQALLYGSRDALVSPSEANTALRLVAHELSTHSNAAYFTKTVRAGALRIVLLERFGAKVWDVMSKLWRVAPVSPGASVPNEDQSRCSPGASDCPRSMPAWRREFHQEVSNEQRMLEGIGGWPGS
jgi:hypothetical protein